MVSAEPPGPARPRLGPVSIYDTRREAVVPLEPLAPPRVGMFVCGVTPYKPSHIGHARTFVFFDVVARFLRQQGYHVFYVQNVTDIEDKIIRQAAEEGVPSATVSERNFLQYQRDMETLGARSVNLYARCTDYLPEIIEQIGQLITRGLAYPVDGDVYYEVAKFPAFGALSKQRTESLQAGARVEVDPRKRAPEDFALWKGAKPGEPWWESPWGHGRPGWHIEDTAITVNVLGPRYDLHGGGAELKFPHHEAEVAQAEGATGESPLAAIWMHAGLLNMRGEKMSKSLGNVISLEETLKTFPPAVLRHFLLSGLYRSPLDYAGPTTLEEARRSFETLSAPYLRLLDLRSDVVGRGGEGHRLGPELLRASESTVTAMTAAMSQDFNVREATSALFTWTRKVQETLTSSEAWEVAALDGLLAPYRWADEVLGTFGLIVRPTSPPADLGALVEVVLKARQRARARGDFSEADKLRAELSEAGITVEDGPKGPRWRRSSEGGR